MLLLSRIVGSLVAAGSAAFLELLLISAIEDLFRVRVFAFILLVLPIVAGIAGYRAAGALWQVHRGVGVRTTVLNSARAMPPLKRLIVAVTCFWVFAVVAYVIVFSPYGSPMSQGEAAELSKIILFPPFLLLVAAIAARNLFFHEKGRKGEVSGPAQQVERPKVIGAELMDKERNSQDKVRRAIHDEVQEFKRDSSNLTASLSRGLVLGVVVFNAGLLGYIAFDRLWTDGRSSIPGAHGRSSNPNSDSLAYTEIPLNELTADVDSQNKEEPEDSRGNSHESSSAYLGAHEHHSASFDCSKAEGFVEETICSDAALAQMDWRMAERFHEHLKTAKNPGAVRSAQRRWLSEVRNRCLKRSCLMQAYSARLGELSLETASPGSDSDATTSVDFVEQLLPGVRRPAGL